MRQEEAMAAASPFRFDPRLAILSPPYEQFETIDYSCWRAPNLPPRGLAMVWWLADASHQIEEFEWLYQRPAGLPLFIVLPPPSAITGLVPLVNHLDALEPRAVLPHGRIIAPHRLRLLLGAGPRHLARAAVAYLCRRGILIDIAQRREVLKIFELSTEVSSISRLARRMYTSRRTMGRHFENAGLPVPSHWLQFGRLLHVAIKLQAEPMPICRVATRYGYPDGFTLSNQMKRLVGCRPTEVRENLGWEWFIERWLQCEARAGRVCARRYSHVVSQYVGRRVPV
jgi:AraC-like DNA-binding protein